MPDTDVQEKIRFETARRLDEITSRPGAILKWDLDGDGHLDDHEWSVLRAVVEADVVREFDGGPSTLQTDDEPEPETESAPTGLVEDTDPWDVDSNFIDPHMDLPVLEVIDARYEVLKELGRGSQGQTHLGRSRSTGEYVAIKELSFQHVDSWKSLELFDREADVLRAIDHPAIPDFVDSFHVDIADSTTRFFIVQEFVSGTSLDVVLARGERFSEDEMKRFGTEMLSILEYLHDLHPPVVHRDVKPSNIIRRDDGSYALVDFGGVQVIVQDDVGGSTVVGTSGYMPPEQLTGRAVPASDLYGLGATLAHICTSIHPSKLNQVRLKLDWRSRASLRGPFADWIDRLLEPVVEDRFQSAGEALANLSGEPSTAMIRTSPAALVHRKPKSQQVAVHSRLELMRDRKSPGGAASVDVEHGVVVLRMHSSHAAVNTYAALGSISIGLMALAVAQTLAFLIIGVVVALGFAADGLRGGSPEVLRLRQDRGFRLQQPGGPDAVVETGMLEAVQFEGTRLLLVTNTGKRIGVGRQLDDSELRWVRDRIDDFLNLIVEEDRR